jgi:hypothetical protein
MTQLYRHFDSSGTLLYVGISSSALVRLSQHSRTAEWFELVARISVENFQSKEDALRAEKLAIQTEYPIYNKVHNNIKIETEVEGIYLFSGTNYATRQLTSLVALKVWNELLHYLAVLESSRNSCTIFMEHKLIASSLGIDASGVTKAISDLKKVGLVLDLKKRKQITINPLYAWNGNLKLWQDYVEELVKQNIIHLPTKEKQ